MLLKIIINFKKMKEVIQIKYWKDLAGNPIFPISKSRPIIKCFHEKQCEPKHGDITTKCLICYQEKVDVDAMRNEIKRLRKEIDKMPGFIRKLLRIRGVDTNLF